MKIAARRSSFFMRLIVIHSLQINDCDFYVTRLDAGCGYLPRLVVE